MGPSWQVGILPFMEQRNIYDKMMATQRSGGPGNNQFIAADMNAHTGGALNRLVPDYMRCPSSPIDEMQTPTGPIVLPTYVGIAGGTDIIQGTTLYPQQQWGIPSGGRSYGNRHGATFGMGGATAIVMTNSGMLPLAEQKGMQNCTDGTSNTMIVGEQSDWLRSRNQNDSTKFHGDPGWNTDTNAMGGFVSGTVEVRRVPQQGWSNSWDPNGLVFNITTVRYKPDLKNVMPDGSNPAAPGCAEVCGLNNPLQSAHPGGILVSFVDGSVQFISGTTDLRVLLQIAICDDGQNVKLD
jgi:hypothetical protein